MGLKGLMVSFKDNLFKGIQTTTAEVHLLDLAVFCSNHQSLTKICPATSPKTGDKHVGSLRVVDNKGRAVLIGPLGVCTPCNSNPLRIVKLLKMDSYQLRWRM